MAVKRVTAKIDVLTAAKQRVLNIFRNGLPVYLSFSGGKDSLSLAQIVLEFIQEGKIDPSQLIVQFIDEEAIFPCIEETVKEWRNKFMLLGSKFEWYCVEVKHYNCFNALTNDESFICWDRYKEAVWVRRPPSFAIREHPLLRPRVDAYQDFMPRTSTDGLSIIGVRTAESIQRLQNIAAITRSGKAKNAKNQLFPIYDWTDKDVWLYLKQHHVKIPEIYLFLWQAGANRRQLRVSQFFSVDTARSLVQMNEYYPDLMERITRREPNAYLAALYWDSEMFGRNSRKRRSLEGEQQIDYKAKLIVLFSEMDKNFGASGHKRTVANGYRNFFMKVSSIATPTEFRRIYEGIISGDPKMRTLRALHNTVFGRYADQAKKGVI